MSTRKPYPSDVSDEEWAFVAPYLALLREDAPQLTHDLREVLNGLRWVVRTGSAWRYMPHDLPPWEAVYQQTRRWLSAGLFEEMVHDLHLLFCDFQRAGCQSRRRRYSTLALYAPPRRVALGAATTERSERRAQEGARGGGDLGAPARLARYSGKRAGQRADGRVGPSHPRRNRRVGGVGVRGAGLQRGTSGLRSRGAWHPFGDGQASGEQTRLLVLLPRRWVVERDFAWASRFRRLVEDYERLAATLAGLHFVAIACLFLRQAIAVFGVGP